MRLEHITWPKAEEYFKTNDMVIIAVGSVESHGTHNPLGVDTIVPNKILELIEEKSNVLIAPTIPYGATDYLSDFPGTITLGPDVLYAVLSQVTQSFYRHGARKFVFLNGHGGNNSSLERVSLDLSRKGAMAVLMNWWLMAWDLNPAWKGGHGGAEETSAVMAIDPSLVDTTNIQPMNLHNHITENIKTSGFKTVNFKGIDLPMCRPITSFTNNGWVGADHPEQATAQWGKEMLQAVADYIVEFMEEFKKAEL